MTLAMIDTPRLCPMRSANLAWSMRAAGIVLRSSGRCQRKRSPGWLYRPGRRRPGPGVAHNSAHSVLDGDLRIARNHVRLKQFDGQRDAGPMVKRGHRAFEQLRKGFAARSQVRQASRWQAAMLC